MRVTPRTLGGMAAILVAGVASGAVIGKVPPMKRLAPDYLLPQAASAEPAWSSQVALPDHYPIVTPEGRFEVYELSSRGLYRAARYAPSGFDDADYAAALAYDETLPAAIDGADIEIGDSPAAVVPGEMAVAPAADLAPRFDPPPADDPATNPAAAVAPPTARVIDVTAELAARP